MIPIFVQTILLKSKTQFCGVKSKPQYNKTHIYPLSMITILLIETESIKNMTREH